MYIFQDQKVDRVTELKEDIESTMATYKMRVDEATHIEKDISQMDDSVFKIVTESTEASHYHEINQKGMTEFVEEARAKKEQIEAKT